MNCPLEVNKSCFTRQWNVNMTSNVIMKLESPVTTNQLDLDRLNEQATFVCSPCSSARATRFDQLLTFPAHRDSTSAVCPVSQSWPYYRESSLEPLLTIQ